MREKHECPKCGIPTMGVPHHDGGYYLRCPDCLSQYFGGRWIFNEKDEYAIHVKDKSEIGRLVKMVLKKMSQILERQENNE